MADLFPLHTNDRDRVFQVPRDCLLTQPYFQAMVTNKPDHLFLPFPAFVVEHIVGRLQHGDNWLVPADVNVRLGFHYCQMDPGSIQSPAEPIPAPRPSLAETIASLSLTDSPFVVDEVEESGRMHFMAASTASSTALVGFRFPLEADILFLLKNNGNPQIVFRVTPSSYELAFDILSDGMVLKQKYLQILNENSSQFQVEVLPGALFSSIIVNDMKI